MFFWIDKKQAQAARAKGRHIKKEEEKTMYKAVARMKDDGHEWDVIIYSMYDTFEEAERDAKRFEEKYNNNDSWVRCLYVQVFEA